MASESKYRKMDKKLHWGTAKEFGKKSPKLKRIAFFTRFATKEKAEAYAKDRMEAHFADPSKEHDRFYCEVEPILSWEDQKAAEAEGKQVRICIDANRTTGKVDITYKPSSSKEGLLS